MVLKDAVVEKGLTTGIDVVAGIVLLVAAVVAALAVIGGTLIDLLGLLL